MIYALRVFSYQIINIFILEKLRENGNTKLKNMQRETNRETRNREKKTKIVF